MVNAYDELLDFVTSGPTLQQIVDFQHSTQTLERVQYLLWLEETQTYSPEEHEELREFHKAAYFIEQLKIRARRRLGINT
jgi:hypothetical protein